MVSAGHDLIYVGFIAISGARVVSLTPPVPNFLTLESGAECTIEKVTACDRNSSSTEADKH